MSLHKYVFTGVVVYLLLLLAGYWWSPELALNAVVATPLIALVLYALLYELDVLYYATAAVLPLSFNIRSVVGNAGVVFPAEPMMAFLAFAVVVRWVSKPALFKSLLQQPQHLLVVLYAVWMIITTVTSVNIIVSGKFVLINTVFLLALYFYAVDLFLYCKKNTFHRFYWFYLIPFLGAVGYTLYRHSLFDFTQRAANLAGFPVYNDHTVYAAVIAILLFLSIGYFFYDERKWLKLIMLLVIVILIIALVFSFSRAAWLSMGVAFVSAVFFYFRVSFHRLITVVMAFGLAFVFSWPYVHQQISQHTAVSGEKLVEHATSAFNITEDVSNKERLNRWSCAIRIFEDYPLTGVGPANFKFAYADYQLPEETTNISVYDGSLGGTHSDYLKALTETGLPGMLIFVAIVLSALYNGMRLLRQQHHFKERIMVVLVLTAFVSFLVHILFNEFLDDAKAAYLFWGIVAYFNVKK